MGKTSNLPIWDNFRKPEGSYDFVNVCPICSVVIYPPADR